MQSQKIITLFNDLYEKSGENLNQLIKNNSIIDLPDLGVDFGVYLKNFLDVIVEESLSNDNIVDLDELPTVDNCDQFIEWVREYVNDTLQPVKDTGFIKELTLEEFEKIVRFCYQNYVIVDSGKTMVDGMDDKWTMNQIETLRKVILTVAELQILRLYSRGRVLRNINEIFRLSDDYGNILIDIIGENEDRLWKYLMYMRQERLENMLELLVDMA